MTNRCRESTQSLAWQPSSEKEHEKLALGLALTQPQKTSSTTWTLQMMLAQTEGCREQVPPPLLESVPSRNPLSLQKTSEHMSTEELPARAIGSCTTANPGAHSLQTLPRLGRHWHLFHPFTLTTTCGVKTITIRTGVIRNRTQNVQELDLDHMPCERGAWAQMHSGTLSAMLSQESCLRGPWMRRWEFHEAHSLQKYKWADEPASFPLARFWGARNQYT